LLVFSLGTAPLLNASRIVSRNRNQASLEFGKAVHSDESSGGAPLNYFLPLHFFQAASH
jgi:hypothetical protein